MSTKNCVSSLIYFSEHTVWARCRKPLKTLLVILGSIHKFGLICMFVIASFRCTLNSHILLVVLLVILCLENLGNVCDVQIQLYIFLLDLVYLVFVKTNLLETSL